MATYSKDGKKSGTMTIPRELAETKPNQTLLHQVVTGLLANRRRATAHTKQRGEVSGGGRKPWRQKGTGRARAGSIRSPLWRGGGAVFGPRSNRNYSHRVAQSMKQLAFRQVLAEKIREGEVFVVATFDLAKPKTRFMEAWLQRLPLKEGRILFVGVDTTAEQSRAMKNLPYLTLRTPGTVNLLDLLVADSVLMTKKAFEALEKRYAKR